MDAAALTRRPERRCAPLTGFSRCGYALLAARARIAYATAARRDDRTGAADALRQAAAGFDACGAVPRRDHARELLAQLESGRSDGSDGRPAAGVVSGPASLTERERQVAELAARGYTAQRIADRLHISARTVETHLARIYAKLGATSKQDLIHRAAELGLPPGP
ncbi:MAG: response regulator transcription factor [Egibacteraceae bacterium]